MVIKIEAKSYGLGREEERGTDQHKDGVRAARNDMEMTQGSRIRRCRLPNLTLVPEETGALPLGDAPSRGKGDGSACRCRPRLNAPLLVTRREGAAW